jgi:hypothetical protein
VKQARATVLANDKQLDTREKLTADQTFDAYFLATHREADKAAASFRAMFKE